MILNLGCGSDIHRDAWNVDFRPGPGVDEVVDLSILPWAAFVEGLYDEVRMFDFLEHFERSKTRAILSECHRILKTGGRLIVQVPDMEILANAVLGNSDFPCFRCGGFLKDCVCRVCGADDNANRDAAIGRIYGGQDYPGNYHMAGFTIRSLIDELESAGFGQYELLEEDHQRANWNLKMSAVKHAVSLWR